MLASWNATTLPGADTTPYGAANVNASVRVRDVGGSTHAPNAADARAYGPSSVEDAPAARATHLANVATVAS